MIDVGDYISEIEVNVYNGNADAMNLLKYNVHVSD